MATVTQCRLLTWKAETRAANPVQIHRTAPVYVVDEVLERHGHKPLRLPPYHADLNAKELIWSQLKVYVYIKKNVFCLNQIQTHFCDHHD